MTRHGEKGITNANETGKKCTSNNFSEISSSHGSKNKDDSLLGYGAM
jgi:hypothetical protein